MAKMVKCETCGAEIAANAKTCPSCGGKNKKPVYKQWWFWVIIIILIIGIGGGASNNDTPTKVDTADESKETTISVDAEKEPEQKVEEQADEKQTAEEQSKYTIGDTADFNGIQVKLSAAILSNGDGQFVVPDEGKQFLCLIIDINNSSSADIAVSSMISFEAYCDDYSLMQDILGLQAPEVDGLNQLDGNVASGKRMNGKICYQVPVDFKIFELNYSPSFWGNKKVTFVIDSDDVDRSGL